MSVIFETSRDLLTLLFIFRDFDTHPVLQALPVFQGAVWGQRHPTPLPPQYFAHQVNKVLKQWKGTTEAVDHWATLDHEEKEAHEEIGETKTP